MHVMSLLSHGDAYALAAQPDFASDAWFHVISQLPLGHAAFALGASGVLPYCSTTVLC